MGSDILIIGDVMLDEYIQGTCERISPEAPVPIVRFVDKLAKLGGAANVAIGTANLGIETALLGTIGSDKNGKVVQEMLETESVRHDFVIDLKNPTNKKTRIQVDGHQLLRIDEEPHCLATGEAVYEKFKLWISSIKLVVLSDYNKGNLSHSKKIISLCTFHKKIILVDHKVNNWDNYAGCDLITPNSKEFSEACIFEGLTGDIETCAYKLIERYQVKAILVTMGANGMKLFRKNMPIFTVQSVAQEVFDVTGAGDTTIAVLAKFLSVGANIEEAILMANTAAGITVSKIGTYAVSQEELDYANHKVTTVYNKKILDAVRLSESVKKIRNTSNAKIAFTNGCFDILHSGHIRYLQECKKYADILIVAVNSDQSVSALKGFDRPINSAENRCELLSALSVVDYVTIFDADTPEELIKKIKPDALIKGGDYDVNEIGGSKFILENGGEVHALKYHQNKSTTAIINKIKGLDQ